jgi:hypothetical protein
MFTSPDCDYAKLRCQTFNPRITKHLEMGANAVIQNIWFLLMPLFIAQESIFALLRTITRNLRRCPIHQPAP